LNIRMFVTNEQIEGCIMVKDEHFTACKEEEQSTEKTCKKSKSSTEMGTHRYRHRIDIK